MLGDLHLRVTTLFYTVNPHFKLRVRLGQDSVKRFFAFVPVVRKQRFLWVLRRRLDQFFEACVALAEPQSAERA